MTQRALNRFGSYHGEISPNLVSPSQFMDYSTLLEELDDGTDLGLSLEESYWTDINEVGLQHCDIDDDEHSYEMSLEENEDYLPSHLGVPRYTAGIPFDVDSPEETVASFDQVTEEDDHYYTPRLQCGRTNNNRVVRSWDEGDYYAYKRRSGRHSRRGHGRTAQEPWKVHAGRHRRASIRHYSAPEPVR